MTKLRSRSRLHADKRYRSVTTSAFSENISFTRLPTFRRCHCQSTVSIEDHRRPPIAVCWPSAPVHAGTTLCPLSSSVCTDRSVRRKPRVTPRPITPLTTLKPAVGPSRHAVTVSAVSGRAPRHRLCTALTSLHNCARCTCSVHCERRAMCNAPHCKAAGQSSALSVLKLDCSDWRRTADHSGLPMMYCS